MTSEEGANPMADRIAYLPLDNQSDPIADSAILSALATAAAFGCKVHATVFSVNVPPVASPLGGFVINVEGLARAVEERSRAECARQAAVIEAAPVAKGLLDVTTREVAMGGVPAAAVAESRLFDLSVVPVAAGSTAPQDLAQALVFDSGLPVMLLAEGVQPAPLDHIAIAWDGSRVAARALQDALGLLQPGGRISVLTVQGEKKLAATDPAGTLAAALKARGHAAEAVPLALEGRRIADVLQTGAMDRGARLLAMGGFGHSRLRDFVLGGATLGVLSHLRMPVLLSH
jgi:nucleotide-binding universal stress UspA family protein